MTIRLVPRGDAKGHRLIRVDGEDVENPEGHPRFVAEHRLAAYAWDLIDSLDDPREIDHVDVVPCHTAEDNLEPREPDEHGRITRERVKERRASA